MRPQLFYTPGTCALASLITCFDAGFDPEITYVSFAKGEQKTPEYLATNPKGRVPALKFGNTVVTETPAILGLLAELSPKAQLMPGEPLERAEVQSFNSYLCSTLHVAHAHRVRGYRWVDGIEHEEAMRRKVPEAVSACYRYIEETMPLKPYVFGQQYTLSDPYLFTISQWMESDGVDPGLFPKVRAHTEIMRERPSVSRALDIERDLTEA